MMTQTSEKTTTEALVSPMQPAPVLGEHTNTGIKLNGTPRVGGDLTQLSDKNIEIRNNISGDSNSNISFTITNNNIEPDKSRIHSNLNDLKPNEIDQNRMDSSKENIHTNPNPSNPSLSDPITTTDNNVNSTANTTALSNTDTAKEQTEEEHNILKKDSPPVATTENTSAISEKSATVDTRVVADNDIAAIATTTNIIAASTTSSKEPISTGNTVSDTVFDNTENVTSTIVSNNASTVVESDSKKNNAVGSNNSGNSNTMSQHGVEQQEMHRQQMNQQLLQQRQLLLQQQQLHQQRILQQQQQLKQQRNMITAFGQNKDENTGEKVAVSEHFSEQRSQPPPSSLQKQPHHVAPQIVQQPNYVDDYSDGELSIDASDGEEHSAYEPSFDDENVSDDEYGQNRNVSDDNQQSINYSDPEIIAEELKEPPTMPDTLGIIDEYQDYGRDSANEEYRYSSDNDDDLSYDEDDDNEDLEEDNLFNKRQKLS